MSFGRLITRAYLKKPLTVFRDEEVHGHEHLERKMSLFDLLMIGIGGTMGSGVFALAGLIANQYSGPAVVLSFIIGGFSCLFSAASYGELSCRIPSAGSSYAYVYNCMGEYFAVITAWCLTLEYGISAAAVARNWGDKLVIWCTRIDGLTLWPIFQSNGSNVNVFAGLLQFVCVVVLMMGMDISKITINFFTIFKLVLIAFMIIAGFSCFDSQNLVPFEPFGVSGVMKGATSCIFGLLGYDEVCCLAAEAHNPHRNLPIAVFGTIAVVSIFYCLAALALVGMQDYQSISPDSGFTVAFQSNGLPWVARIVAIGELVCLPIVVLICFLAQPRFLFAMAEDGLMPKLFAEVDNSGNFVKGIAASGVVCTLIALLMPFTYLNDMISAGVLFSFNLTNTSLIMIRKCGVEDTAETAQRNRNCEAVLLRFHIAGLIFAFSFVGIDFGILFSQWTINGVVCLVTLMLIIYQSAQLSSPTEFPDVPDEDALTQYRVPLVPLTPMIGVLINYILIAQQSWTGLVLVLVYFVLATIAYVCYGSADAKWKLEAEAAGQNVHSRTNKGIVARMVGEQHSLLGLDHSTYGGNYNAL